MYIPPLSADAGTNDFNTYLLAASGSSTAAASEGWSSLIGVVTAICGNILISFALNTQRYAHLRLGRERTEQQERQRHERKMGSRATGYGTQQSDIAEERARTNHKSEPGEYVLEEAEETDLLIPSVGSLHSKHSSGSSNHSTQSEEDDDEDPVKEKSYLRSPIWWLGISMMTVGEAGNFLAYGFAPASIVSPLGVVALISNCLIAPLLLHERFRWRDALGVVVAVGGCVTVVLSASDSNPKLTPDSIWHLITRWEFETYLGITVFLIIVLCIASNRYGDRTIMIDIGLVGLFGGYTALSTKGVASLLSSSVWRVITFPITYLLVGVLVFTAVMQIKYINRALQRFNSTMVIPTQFVTFTISVIVGSAILYRDFERTTGEDAGKFVGGCALTFLGVYFITSGRGDENQGDDEPVETEDGISLIDEERPRQEVRERDDTTGRRQSLLGASSSKSAPPLGRLLTDDSIAPDANMGSLARISETEDNAQPPSMSPAKIAAIHGNSASGLPRRFSKGPPPMHATTSSPDVPTTTNLTPSRPKTPLRRGQSTSVVESPTKLAPSTPRRRPVAEQNTYLDPNNSRTLMSRQSVVGLIPGPLTSPLSSSLSAIVADSLRRGVDRPSPFQRRSTTRRQRYSNAGIQDPNATTPKRQSLASGEMDFAAENDDQAAELRRGSVGDTPTKASDRVRSLSATLGDIFTSSGGKRSSREENLGEASRREEDGG